MIGGLLIVFSNSLPIVYTAISMTAPGVKSHLTYPAMTLSDAKYTSDGACYKYNHNFKILKI